MKEKPLIVWVSNPRLWGKYEEEWALQTVMFSIGKPEWYLIFGTPLKGSWVEFYEREKLNNI